MASMSDGDRLHEDVLAVAAFWGLHQRDVAWPSVQGQVNLTAFLGDELVLRLPRTARAEQLLAKEAEVIPLVCAAGVATPELISYDATLRIASVPYLLQRRVPGVTLARLEPDLHPMAHHCLGEALATLHQIRQCSSESGGLIPEPYDFSPGELLGRLVDAGEIGTAQQGWLSEQFTRLQPGGPTQADPVLVHRDVNPTNVLFDPTGKLTALLDWGCAEWGSPARDLVGLPIGALPNLLAGYLAARPDSRDGDGTLARNALWYHLYLALAGLLKEPSTSEERNWAAPRNASLIDLLTFLSGAAGGLWGALRRSDLR